MKKVLAISICVSVSFVVVMLFLSHRESQEIDSLKVEPTTDEIANVSGHSQRFERNEDSPRSTVGDNQENSDVAITDEVTTPDAVKLVATVNEASNLVSEAEDEEFEAQWKEVEKLAKKILGKDLEEFAEEYFADLRVRVDESVAQIELLFDDMAFYESQLEPLKRQENWQEYSVAWAKSRDAAAHLYGLYVFLGKEGPAREHFGHLYLSTPEHAKLKTFAEEYYANE